jgi:phosphonopyruvate decarboxylase
VTLAEVSATIARAGVRLVSGVPCSILEPLQRELEGRAFARYVPASVEGEAVALACGAWLGGGLGLLLLQNSGLGNSVNPLLSLAVPYRIPLVMVVSWRAQPGREDALHHVPMGRVTRPLLELLSIPQRVFGERPLSEDFAWALAQAVQERQPVALIAPRGSLGKGAPRGPAQLCFAPSPPAEPARFGSVDRPAPTRRALRDQWFLAFPEARCVATTGYMARDVAELGRPERHFPMQGSMGFAAALALGIRLTHAAGPVCVLDGDGALYMRLSSLGTVGHAQPARFAHLIADNASYTSTGGQPTPSARFDFARAALALGYAYAADCLSADALPEALAWLARHGAGPALLRCRVQPDLGASAERPGQEPATLAALFRADAQRAAP